MKKLIETAIAIIVAASVLAGGMSPATKNAQLCDELERLDPGNPVLKNNRHTGEV